MKYRKKPVEVEAILFEGGEESGRRVEEWSGSAPVTWHERLYGLDHDVIVILTLEGEMVATPGDYIIRGVHGEFYPCKPDIFEATYEEVYDDSISR